MSKPFLTGLLLLSTAALLAACGEPEDTHPGQPVKQRQQAFKEIIKSFEPMGVMLRKGSYEPDRFLAFAEKLHAARDLPWRHFGPDTHYPPSKARAELWQQQEQFEADKQAFLQASEALLAAAQSKDKARIQPAYDAVHESCKACHDRFKAR
ncbi:MAG: c-type cytochrome [Azonexus sp.]